LLRRKKVERGKEKEERVSLVLLLKARPFSFQLSKKAAAAALLPPKRGRSLEKERKKQLNLLPSHDRVSLRPEPVSEAREGVEDLALGAPDVLLQP
jgi:hypothetical protein